MNKVLIKLFVPEVDDSFDVFIPVNEMVWKVRKMLVKCVMDITNTSLDSSNYVLINKISGRIYKNNEIIIDTDIRNSSELLLFSIKKDNV